MKHPPGSPPFVGWATVAYPDESSDTYRAMVERQLQAGANFVWIGHNNPGTVERNKVEPALSYAVFEEATEPSAPNHEDAGLILEAQLRFLEVCRQLAVPVVLPVGYQIQMGHWWETRHPGHLRRDAQGGVIDWGGSSASIYSPVYQEDITRYYRWVIETVVRPYRDIIQLINLADEPFGGDYSAPAERVFKKRHGFGFAEVGDDPGRQRALGEFQSDMIVEYACWSAERWHEIEPAIPTTMSFCGFHGREENLMPTVVNLFRKTPPHFEITFDLYPRDGPFAHPITRTDITPLWIFLRQIGGLSRRYDKPLWMWPTGNSWGTGQASLDKGYISDAVANHYYNTDLIVAAGGRLKGSAVWNFNIRNQGLYNDPHETTWDPDEMFERVSAVFAEIHPLMQRSLEAPVEPSARIAVYALPEPGFLRLGQSRAPVARLKKPETRPYDFTVLEMLVHQNTPFAVVADLEDLPAGCDTLIALPETVEELPTAAQKQLEAWPGPGRTLLIGPGLAALFGVSAPQSEYIEHRHNEGTLLIAELSRALRLQVAGQYEALRRRLFGTVDYEPLFHYEVPWRKLWYNLTGEDQSLRRSLEDNQSGVITNRDGSASARATGPGSLEGSLSHHAFAMIKK